MAKQFGEAEYQKQFGSGGTGYAPGAIEFSNAAYDRMFGEEAGYPQRDPNAPRPKPYRRPLPDPIEFANTELKTLGKYYENMFKAASDPREEARIQAEYYAEKFKRNQTLGQMGLVKQLNESGGITDEQSQKMLFELAGINLPAEPVERAVTPSATGVSLAQQMGDVGRLTEIMAEQILHDPFWQGGGEILKDKATAKTKMETLFVNFWDAQNLSDPKNIHKREGFIQAFTMAADNNVHTAKLVKELLDKKTGPVEIRRRISGGNQIIDRFNEKFSDTKPDVSRVAKHMWSLVGAKKPPRGSDQGVYGALNFGRPQTEAVAPKRQTSPSTGRTRISYDGGKTWQNE